MQQLQVVQDTQASEEEFKLARRWHARIKREQRVHEDFRDSALDSYRIYENSDDELEVYYPLLYSVVAIQHSAIYSATPVPIAKARNEDRQPAHKAAADVLERSLQYYLDNTHFDDVLNRSTDDVLVAGLGVPRVKLDATIETLEGEEMEVITDQLVRAEHVPWSRFGWEPAESWDHVGWIYFKHRISVKEVRKRYGEDASFNAGDSDHARHEDEDHEGKARGSRRSRVTVYEVWDKENKQVIHIAEGGSKPLSVMDDPLGISGFYPCPMPSMTNVEFDELIPIPDYQFIKHFDEDLNRLYKRARNLTEQIKAASIHDESFFELESMEEVEDGDSIAVKNVAERTDGKPDMAALIHFFPIEEKARVLQLLNQEIELKRRHVDDLLGISDILRGSSNPQDGQETQKIKERWSGIRLRRKQVMVQKMVRNMLRIMAEVTVKHVTPANLAAMTQVQIGPEVLGLLQDDVLRSFTVDIETDSTVARDEFEDKRQRNELLQAVAQYVQVVAPAVSQNMIPADLGKEVLQIAMAPYHDQARGLEEVIEQMPTTQKQLAQIQQLQQQLQQKTQEGQQKDYALSQFSQAEEQRKNSEVQSKTAREQAQAQKLLSEIPDEQQQATLTQVKAMKEQASVGNVEADTVLKQAQTAEILTPESRNEP